MTIALRSTLPLTPPTEITHRLDCFRAALADADLPLALVTHAVDILYLTGAMPDAHLIVPADGEPTLLVRKSLERARHESPLTDLRPFPGVRGVARLLNEALGAGPVRVGLDLDVVPAVLYRKLADALPNATWVDTGGLSRTVRAIKSPWEIDRHRAAAAQIGTAFDQVRDHLRPGVTEAEISILAETAMRRGGHQGLVRFRRPGMSLWLAVVGSGLGTAYPTAFDGPVGSDGLHPGSGVVAAVRPIQPGVTVMADLVGNFGGYHADIARTFCIGTPPDAVLRAHDFCREALRRIEALLRPGTPWGEVYQTVAAWAAGAGEPMGFMGYGENRVKFFGHGVGLEVDEHPILANGFRQPLEAGMIVAVEPKAFDPDLGPAGLEQTYLITDHGPEPLLDYPQEIIVV